MNKLVLSLLIVIVLFTITGCSEKFNIAAPYKNITVIYAFLEQTDTAHYIRVEKAFLDQNKNALTMAQTPDSSYYANINVRIDRIKYNDANLLVHDTIHLNRVDLNLEGYPKQPGVFFTAPNYAYKFTDVLDPSYFYRIVVTNLSTGQVDSAMSPVINENPSTYTIDVLDELSQNLAGIDLSSTLPSNTFEMNIGYHIPVDFDFNGQISPAFVAHTIIRFNWVDSNIGTGAQTAHSYDYVLDDMVMSSGAAATYDIKPLSMYAALSTALGAAPAATIRLIDRCDLFFYLGTYDYYGYQQASLTQGVGLTGNEIEPVFTNIKGPDALGLFTARGERTGKINFTPVSIDSMIVSPYLTNARIKGTVY